MNMLIDSYEGNVYEENARVFMKERCNADTAPAKTKANRPSIHPSTCHDSPPLSVSFCNICSSIALHCDKSWTFTARPHALRIKGVFTNSLAFGLEANGLEHNFKNS